MKIPTGTSPLSSGAPVWAKISESYNFYSGDLILTDPFTEDIILYNYNLPGLPAVAGFRATPSITFEPLSLQKGVITVEMQAPAEGAAGVPLISPDGGTISLTTGQNFVFSPGATSVYMPVEIKPISSDEISALIPGWFSVLGGLSIDFQGQLLLPSSISIPAPPGFDGTGQILLVQLIDLQGATRLALAGVGKLQNGNIVSDSVISGTDFRLPGITSGGRYVFMGLSDFPKG